METGEVLTGFIQLGLLAAAVTLAAILVVQFASLCNSIHELGKEKRNSGMGRFFDRSRERGSPEECLKNFSAGIKEIGEHLCQSLNRTV